MMTKTGTPVQINSDSPIQESSEGWFIVFEGIDGSGKSTACKEFYRRLNRENAILTAEPTYESIFGSIIRKGLDSRRTPQEEYWLFQLDRAQHYRDVIQPSLQSGKTVICDRFYPSTVIYQHSDSGMTLKEWHDKVLSDTLKIAQEPDFLFILDLDPQTAIDRIKAYRQPDAFETLDNLKRSRDAYLEMWAGKPNVSVFNADDSTENIVAQMRDAFRSKVPAYQAVRRLANLLAENPVPVA